jgi:Flp pilus assembly protein TadD
MAAVLAARAAPAAENRLNSAVSRCSKLSDLIACAAALSMKPRDPGLLVAEGDALVALLRPGEAIGVYRNAVRSGALPDAVNPKIAAAEGHRHSLLDACLTQSGAAAEHACESAWLPGAPDEVTVFKRRGLLLRNDHQAALSLDAYMAAARLAPRDREVARAVVELSENTQRPDASTLTARGAALMTLGRRADALIPLREALRLDPGSRLAGERLRAIDMVESPRRSSAAASSAAPGTHAGPPAGTFSNLAPVTRSN